MIMITENAYVSNSPVHTVKSWMNALHHLTNQKQHRMLRKLLGASYIA